MNDALLRPNRGRTPHLLASLVLAATVARATPPLPCRAIAGDAPGLLAGLTGTPAQRADLDVCANWCKVVPASQACLVWLRFGTNGVAAYLASTVETDRDLKDLARQQGLTGPDVDDFDQFLEARRRYPLPPEVERDPELRRRVEESGAATGRLTIKVELGDVAGAVGEALLILGERETLLGKDHPLTAQARANAAFLQMELGNLDGAEPLLREALRARERSLGPEDAETAMSALNLASLLQIRGRLDEAEALVTPVVQTFERVYGRLHPNVAGARSTIANLALARGHHDAARRELERSLAVLGAVQGRGVMLTLQLEATLGGLLVDLGDLGGATPVLESALAAAEQSLAPDHPLVAMLLQHLARAESDLGRLGDALAHFERALAIARTRFGEDHPMVIFCIQGLGLVLERAGRRADALTLHEHALARAEATLGADHIATAAIRTATGALWVRAGRLDAGREALNVALEAQESWLGKDHILVAETLGQLGIAALVAGDVAGARPLLSRSLRIARAHLERNLHAAGSETGVLGLALKFRNVVDAALAAALAPETGGAGPREALALLIAWQGAGTLLESVWRDQLRAVESGAGSAAATLWESLRELDREYSALVAAASDSKTTSKRLTELATAREKVVKRLSQAMPALASARRPWALGPDELCATLTSERASLVDIVMRRDPMALVGDGTAALADREEAGAIYGALVVTPRREPGKGAPWCDVRHVPLGSLVEITRDVGIFRAAVDVASRCDGVACEPAETALHRALVILSQRLWAPLKPYANRGALWVVADGVIGDVPVASLLDDDAGTVAHLVERRSVTLLPYPAAVAAPRGAWAGRALVIGDLDYQGATPQLSAARCTPGGCGPPSTVEAGPRLASATWARRSAGVCGHGATWSDLTPTEAVAVASSLGATTKAHSFSDVALVTGRGAPEAAVAAALPGARLVHLATHGFYSPRASCPLAAGARVDPLRLSAVVLSGANAARVAGPTDPAEDGLLTARDVAGLGLGRTELVVLSACETALGTTISGEGRLGLARAFGVAGVGTTIAAAWEVPSDATTALFTDFYERLNAGDGPADALRAAQLRAIERGRQDGGRASITTWAAFEPLVFRQ
ncbi:MAG: CHAT domain-containing protein [Myxococcales bacterium]|nr:CHAT domain-containing protein [Myxococcales bacterium]